MHKPIILAATAAACGLALVSIADAQQSAQIPSGGVSTDASPSSSLLVTTPVIQNPNNDREYEPHALRDVSLFAVAPPQPREFMVHDLVQIIVRESSTASSSQELETKKETKLDGAVPQWPNINLHDLLRLTLHQSDDSDNPAFQLDFTKDFKGEGDYERKDDLSARITAEVIEVLPNGNLILEARTHIKTDKEEQTMQVTGICRPEDITPLNTINSNQIHDLTIEKMHQGELKDAGKKGILTKVFETLFAF
jgi:flagellar L-ring protein precursor FlgH